MFSDKPYYEVNREERNYCALLAHAILSSSIVRKRFTDLIAEKFKFDLQPSTLEVYLEVAALRDYWFNLGSSVEYLPETHEKRRSILNSALESEGLPPSTIDTHDLFWTSSKRVKLWYPGRWEISELKKVNLDKLVDIRWAFNAKPDIALISDTNVLIIEGKLESGEGTNEDSGYEQLKIQRKIVELMKKLIPKFENIKLALLSLREDDQSISWSEATRLLDGGGLDTFTMMAFHSLKERYKL